MEGNNQTSGTLMSLEGEDLSTGTILQIDKRSYNRSTTKSRYKLLHARTSSTNFTNAVLISQDLLQHANSTIVSLRSKKIIEGSLLKMSLDDSASESSKIISVIASPKHNQGSMVNINANNFNGEAPVALKIVGETDSNKLLHVSTNVLALNNPVVSIRGNSALSDSINHINVVYSICIM